MSTNNATVKRIRSSVSRTRFAITGALRRRDGKLILLGSGFGYILLYLWGIGHVMIAERPMIAPVDVRVVDDPLAMMTRQMAPYQYEPIALIHLAPFGIGPIDFLFAPLNVAIGIGLAMLVGVNMAVAWMAWRGPRACGIGPGASTVAGLPAVISGFACCGPTILLVLGVQASASILAVMQWLLPAAVILLLGTLVWVGRHVDPKVAESN